MYRFKVNKIKDLIPILTKEGERLAVKNLIILTRPTPINKQIDLIKLIELSPPAVLD